MNINVMNVDFKFQIRKWWTHTAALLKISYQELEEQFSKENFKKRTKLP